MDYVPRMLFLGYGGLVVLVTTWGQTHGPIFWAIWFLHFLAWPHVAYLRTRYVDDPRRAELANVTLDAFGVGVWSAYCGFVVPATFMFFAGTALTNLSLGGLRAFAQALVLFAAGAGLWSLLAGLSFRPDGTLAEEILGFGGGMLEIMVIGYASYLRNRRLAEAKGAIEEKSRIFESLVQMGVVTHQTDDIDDLLGRSLEHLIALMPGRGFGIVLFDQGRSKTVSHADFRGIDRLASEAVTRRVGTLPEEVEPFTYLDIDAANHFFVVSMSPHLTQSRGYLIIRDGEHLDSDSRASLQLFLDQVAAALESSLLTLRLKRLASTDPMTGVYNRARFREEFAHAAHKKRGPADIDFAMVVTDVNGLKVINDEYGHDVGDAVIRTAADVLRRVTREIDVLVRMGGDEFVILCNNCNSTAVEEVVERIRHAERQTRVKAQGRDGASLNLELSLSIGRASTDEAGIDTVMRVADERMYADKESHYAAQRRAR